MCARSGLNQMLINECCKYATGFLGLRLGLLFFSIYFYLNQFVISNCLISSTTALINFLLTLPLNVFSINMAAFHDCSRLLTFPISVLNFSYIHYYTSGFRFHSFPYTLSFVQYLRQFFWFSFQISFCNFP